MTINKDRLKAVKTVFFHKSCYDGTAAALICARTYKALGLDPEFVSLQYNTERMDRLEPGPGHLFVDIVPPEDRWEDWKGFDPIVLDHHEGARHVTEGLGGIFGRNDELMCGAALAFEHVMLGLVTGDMSDPNQGTWWKIPKDELEQWRELARMAAIRDTWQDGHEDFKKAQGIARCLGWHGRKPLMEKVLAGELDLGSLFDLAEKLQDDAQRKAELIARRSIVEDVVSRGEQVRLGFFNCTEPLISETAHVLLEEHGCDLAAGFFLTESDSEEDPGTDMVVSVRTRKEEHAPPISAMSVAKHFGGGGHFPAAGFRFKDGRSVSMDELVARVKAAVRTIREG